MRNLQLFFHSNYFLEGSVVTYEYVDSVWNLDVFASLITTTIYNKTSTVITA
jgi:hypothetical protein